MHSLPNATLYSTAKTLSRVSNMDILNAEKCQEHAKEGKDRERHEDKHTHICPSKKKTGSPTQTDREERREKHPKST